MSARLLAFRPDPSVWRKGLFRLSRRLGLQTRGGSGFGLESRNLGVD